MATFHQHFMTVLDDYYMHLTHRHKTYISMCGVNE